ncbi:MAG: hypothetical protein HY336_00160 [Candidatus Doudnabacteria bacterium]|nr:hypothetical protein [Candidatus Doudnabacteria bacterium]
MSSGNSTAVARNPWETAFGQFADAMDLLREGKRSPEDAAKVLGTFISGDEIVVKPRVEIVGGEKVFLITGEFNTAADVIAPYPVKWGYADGKADQIPMVIQPGDVRGRLVNLGRVVYNRELPKLLPNLLDPFNALRFGLKFPDEQRQRPIGTVWRDASGRFWFVCLRVFDGRPDVVVSPGGPGGDWSGGVDFLVRE